ncbi:MAG: phosphate acyltransferase PlsX [Gammaproteobacteria bacterium]
MKISIDAMGGDFGPSVTVPACLYILKKYPTLHLILTGKEGVLRDILKVEGESKNSQITIQNATEIVEMDESPSLALKRKKDSSMRVAINLVKEGTSDACVSAGNTGALMATARFVLRMLPGIDRPAICSGMPGIDGSSHVLDLGANVDSSAEQLFQFAVMGSVLVSAVKNLEKPTVGLLNVGEEEVKGNERVKSAAKLIANSKLNYVGFVEGNDIYTGKTDVIVCDGFMGNVALKASEGVAHMLKSFAKEEFSRSVFTKIGALMSRPVLNAIKTRIDPRRYNGASLLGLKGIVIKSHGSADTLSFAHAIEEAITEIEKNVPEQIKTQLGTHLI